MTLDVVVIGAGTVSRNGHLPLLSRNPRTNLVAVCDADEQKARTAAKDFSIEGETESEKIYEKYSPDWVHICTPVQTHLPIAKEALKNGVPVLIQKPITETVDEFNQLKEIAEQEKLTVSAVHNQSFLPVMREVRKKISRGEIGEILGVDVIFSGEGRPDETPRGSWVFDLPGGELEEGFPHPIYLSLVTGGYPKNQESLSSLSRTFDEYDSSIGYDGVQAQYISQSDAVCSIKILAGGPVQKTIHITGSKRSLLVDLVSMNTITQAEGEGEPNPVDIVTQGISNSVEHIHGIISNGVDFGQYMWETKLNKHSESSVSGHYYQFNETAKAIERGGNPPVTLEEAEWTIRIMEKIRQTA